MWVGIIYYFHSAVTNLLKDITFRGNKTTRKRMICHVAYLLHNVSPPSTFFYFYAAG